MAYCGKCGAKLSEGANFCPKCGNPCGNSSSLPTDEVSVAGQSKKNKSVKAILAVILTICFIGGGLLIWQKNGNEEAEDIVLQEKGELVLQEKNEQPVENNQEEMEQQEQIQFLETFYKGFDNNDWDSHVRMHVTENALQIVRDEYGYDCDDDCLATWIFLYEEGGMGEDEFRGRTIEAISQNTFLVTALWGEFDYKIKLGLVKEGDEYKIDNIERVSGE